MPKAGNNLVGIIYVKFDDVHAGNSLKKNLFMKWIEAMLTYHSY